MSTDNPMDYQSGKSTPGIGERVAESSSQLRSKAAEYGRAAAAKLDSSREAAAGSLDSAAEKLHGNADAGARKITGAAHTVANSLSSTATYIREHDVNGMLSDLYDVVKRNPGPALIGAAALGFLVARGFSRN